MRHLQALWLPGVFAIVSLLVLPAAMRLPRRVRPWVLAADLTSWIPLGLVLVHVGPSDHNVSFALAICVKTGVVLAILALATANRLLSDRQLGVLLAGIALLFFLLPLPFTRLPAGLQLKGDEPHYLVATISLLQDHDLYLENEYTNHVYAPFYNAPLQPQAIAARDGHIASAHDSGLSILALPAYAIGGWLGVLVFLGLLGSLTVRETYLSTRLLGAQPLAGLTAAGLIGFSLPFAVYATQVYAEIAGALVIAFAVRQMLSKLARARTAPLAAGLAIATLPWLHVRFWVLALPLLATGLMVWRQWSERLVLVATLAVSAAAYTGLNALVYGRVIVSPFLLHDTVQSRVFDLLHSTQGLMTIAVTLLRPWLDPYDGVFLLAPIYLLAVAAFPLLLRRATWVTRGIIVSIGVYAAFVGLAYLQNDAGDSPPGRFMVVVAPLLALLLVTVYQPSLRRLTSWPSVALAAWGGLTVFLSLASPIEASYPLAGTGGPIAMISRRLGVMLAAAVPSFTHPQPDSLLKAAAWVLALALIALLLWTRAKPPYNWRDADIPGGRDRVASPGLRGSRPDPDLAHP